MDNNISIEEIYTMSEERITDVIYDENLSLEQLIVIKQVIKSMNLSNDTKMYVDEMIDDYIDVIYSEEEIKNTLELFKKHNLINDKLKRKEYLLNFKKNQEELKVKTFAQSSNNNSVYGEIKICDIDKYININ